MDPRKSTMPKVHHNLSHTRSYAVWNNIKKRCFNKQTWNYHNYGGRGISIDDPRWLDFKNFYSDMGEAPIGYQLDRIDNHKGYCKENCRWVTPRENALNTRIYKSNSSGIKGVSYEIKRKRWKTKVAIFENKTKLLYQGPDFFEACCARKSWESKHKGNI